MEEISLAASRQKAHPNLLRNTMTQVLADQSSAKVTLLPPTAEETLNSDIFAGSIFAQWNRQFS